MTGEIGVYPDGPTQREQLRARGPRPDRVAGVGGAAAGRDVRQRRFIPSREGSDLQIIAGFIQEPCAEQGRIQRVDREPTGPVRPGSYEANRVGHGFERDVAGLPPGESFGEDDAARGDVQLDDRDEPFRVRGESDRAPLAGRIDPAPVDAGRAVEGRSGGGCLICVLGAGALDVRFKEPVQRGPVAASASAKQAEHENCSRPHAHAPLIITGIP